MLVWCRILTNRLLGRRFSDTSDILCRYKARPSLMRSFIIYCRLKELEIACLRISTNQKMYDTVDFFAGQKELRKVYLTLHHASAEPRLAKTIMFYLLRKLPKLEVLKFHSDCQLKLSEYEYGDLVTTIRNLESLDLRFIECSLEDPSTFTKHRLPSMKYPKLKHLRLNIGSTDEVTRIQTEILSRCRSSLESLSLGVVDLDTVALICTDHVRIPPLLECNVFLLVLLECSCHRNTYYFYFSDVFKKIISQPFPLWYHSNRKTFFRSTSK